MPYTPGTWVEDVTVIHMADMDRIETGVAATTVRADDETITGEWAFASTAAPTSASVLVQLRDFDTGDPIPETGLIYTAAPGSAGNLLYVGYDNGGGFDVPLSVAVDTVSDPPFSFIRVTLPTDSGGALVPTTTAEVKAAVESASALVAVTYESGNDGSALVQSIPLTLLAGGSDTAAVLMSEGEIGSPVRIQPEALNRAALTLADAPGSTLGHAVLNIEYREGNPSPGEYGVTHLDSDGGGAFAGERISWSEGGNLVLNVDSTLVIGDAFAVKDQDTAFFSLQAGTPYVFVVNAHTADQTVATFNPYTGATADVIVVIDGDDGSTPRFRVRPNGEVWADGGLVLKSPDGTQYRVIVANDGALSTEAV
jgi:hypothetical protein